MKTQNSATLNSLTSLAMDLKRVSLGLQRGSTHMAQRFLEEAFRWKREVDLNNVDSYISKILSDLPKVLRSKDDSQKSEKILMYSILLQNYVNNSNKHI